MVLSQSCIALASLCYYITLFYMIPNHRGYRISGFLGPLLDELCLGSLLWVYVSIKPLPTPWTEAALFMFVV